jgi:DNA topoisomerase-3
MGKRLVITEKPSVARDIVETLGGFVEEDGYWENDDFVVTFAVGHLLELKSPEELDDKYKRWTLDTLPILPQDFPLKPKEGTRDRLRVIKKLLERKDVSGLVNACDAGREGELIFREIAEYMDSKKPIERLWLQSMTKSAITGGFGRLEPGVKYEGLSAAAHCRNYSDWLIGMNATRALTRRLKSRSENQAWSAGRVQTPTLRMLVDRELEILGHRPVPYFRIRAIFERGGEPYAGTWYDASFKSKEAEEDERDDRIFSEADARKILDKIAGKPGIAAEQRKPSREAAPPLFDLTSLQREANRKFGWSARRTLNAAQRCYEGHKVLTYPRTDTKALPNDYRAVVEQVIASLGADPRFAQASQKLGREGLQNADKIFDDAKVTDHFAIIPTGDLPKDGLSGDDARLFDLVTRRFLAAFHPPALWSRVERTTVIEGESFRSRAKILQEPGWREVMGESEGSEEKLLPLIPGQDEASGVQVGLQGAELESDETRPPARITEARLLSLMENAGRYVEDEEAAEALKERGIGTPATRADTIENLISKGYVMRAGRALRPSVKGIRLIDILERMNAERLASPGLTGELESHLADVEHGRMKAKSFMDEIYAYTKEIVDLTKSFEFDELFPNHESLGKCPLCKKDVYERSWFYRCIEPEGLPKKREKKDDKKKKKNASEEPEIVDCPFRIWKDKSGRYIDRETVKELLADKKTRILDGFQTRQGRTYRGQLELIDGEIQLKRVAGGEEDGEGLPGLPEYEVDERPVGTCPVCKEGDVVETRATYLCSRGLAVLRKLERDDTTTFPVKKREVPEGMEYCPFLLPRTVCKREITREEVEQYVREGATPLLAEFISQRGRPFSATLHLNDKGRHRFEFPPREGAGDKKRGFRKKAEGKADGEAAAVEPKVAEKKKAAPAKKKAAPKKKVAAKKKAAPKKKKKTVAKKKGSKKADRGIDASPS